jgi:hypothetical protein
MCRRRAPEPCAVPLNDLCPAIGREFSQHSLDIRLNPLNDGDDGAQGFLSVVEALHKHCFQP